MEYILIFISAIFVNNIVLSQFLGICPFLGVSKKVETAMVSELLRESNAITKSLVIRRRNLIRNSISLSIMISCE